jgi:hypothetical protein
VTAWWLAADERIPDFDSGKHMLFALLLRDAWAHGDLLAPMQDLRAARGRLGHLHDARQPGQAAGRVRLLPRAMTAVAPVA